MDPILSQIKDAGGILVLLIPPIVQMLKKMPFLVKLQKADVPAYEILSLALGIAGAFALGIPNAIVAGIVAGLAAGKGYDFVTGNGEKKLPDITVMTGRAIPILLLGCFLLFGGCAETKVRPVAWFLSGANIQSGNSENEIEETLGYTGRIGALFNPKEPNDVVLNGGTEFGFASDWRMSGPRQFFGVYFVQFFPQDPNSLIFGTPYVGAQATIDVKEDGGLASFLTGTILKVNTLDVVTEFRLNSFNDVLKDKTESADKYQGYVGLRVPF